MSNTPTNLKTLTPDEITDAYKTQVAEGAWTFSDEREFGENLFCQRFNFLLVAYSLIITACASTEKMELLKLTLIVGFILCFLTTLAIWRAYAKLIVILNICYRIADHPLVLVDRENKKWSRWHRGVPVNHYLGLWIPIGCTISLAVALWAIYLGGWAPVP
jgi:hypothetical protein